MELRLANGLFLQVRYVFRKQLTMRNFLFILFCIFCPLSGVFAGGWSGASKVLEIYPSPGSNGVFIKHESMPNPDNCPSPGYYILEKNNLFFNEIFTLLASAQARQSLINIQISGCGGPNSLYPSVSQVIAN